MEPKRYIVDIYAEMSDTDVGEDFVIPNGDVRCTETGETFTGTFVVKDLKKADKNERNEGLSNNL